jgi:cytochrome c peroxidase
MGANKETGMATYSCSSCHIPEVGFRPGSVQGIADGGMGFGNNGDSRTMNPDYSETELDIQSARPLSLVNVAFVKNTFWNGQFGSSGANENTESLWSLRSDTERNFLGYEAIETQNIEGIDAHRFLINEALMKSYGYLEMFDSAFPEIAKSERYTNLTGSLAISAYLRTIISDQAPIQDWLKGNADAMSNNEKEGALIFFGKAKCASCHYEKNLGSNEFHALATKDMDQHPDALNKNPDDRRNLGRGGFTLQDEDMFKFRVPGLYNISESPFYFHGSSKDNLRDVITYKLAAKRENIRVPSLSISKKLKAISLTEGEILKLQQFLERSLTDPHLDRFKPNQILSGFCFPNNDYISISDLNCN